jgi:hypothetical protein
MFAYRFSWKTSYLNNQSWHKVVREELHGKVMHCIKCWEKNNLDQNMAWDFFQFLNKFMVEQHAISRTSIQWL